MIDEKKPWRWLDVFTGWMGKITTLIVAVGALVAAWKTIPLPNGDPAPVPTATLTTGCFKPKMTVDPQTVSIKQWNSTMVLKLTGRNDCPEILGVHVAFKALSASVVKLMSHSSGDCGSFDKPNCWEQTSLEQGDIDWTISAPDLKVLSPRPLRDPVKVDINWMIYNVQTKAQLRAGKTRITLRDDP